MSAYGDKEFVDGRGQRHNWRNELAERLIALQGADGLGSTATPKSGGKTSPSLQARGASSLSSTR